MNLNQNMQALFTAGLILLAEKLFLHFVAINFHQKALADRLAENRSGLKALDRLANAHPGPNKKGTNGKRGHKSTGGSFGASEDLPGTVTHSVPHRTGRDGQRLIDEKVEESTTNILSGRAERHQKRRKAMASIIVDQVGGAIYQVALKDSRFNRQGGLGGLYSARRLVRKLFSTLTDVNPPRSHLIVEGAFFRFLYSCET
jgi:hypothetical protein